MDGTTQGNPPPLSRVFHAPFYKYFSRYRWRGRYIACRNYYGLANYFSKVPDMEVPDYWSIQIDHFFMLFLIYLLGTAMLQVPVTIA